MIVFVKPIRIIKEGEPYKPSLIAVGKRDWMIRDKKVIQWKYFVYLNFWLFEINLEFIRPKIEF